MRPSMDGRAVSCLVHFFCCAHIGCIDWTTICFILIRGHSSHAWARYHFMVFFEKYYKLWANIINTNNGLCKQRGSEYCWSIGIHSLTHQFNRSTSTCVPVDRMLFSFRFFFLNSSLCLALYMQRNIKMVNFRWRVDGIKLN